MFSLYRRKIITILLLVSSLTVFGQVKTKYQPNYDNKPLRFGYYIGFANTHFDVKHKPSFYPNQVPGDNGLVYAVTSPNTTAIRAGAVINYVLDDYFDIRFSPLNISVIEREITYVTDDGEKVDNLTSKSWLEMPFHVKYKSERRDNSRLYIFGGFRWGFETNIINRKGNQLSFSNKSMRTNDLMIEYGMGLELFREYFKMTPEVHFSHGVLNMIRPDHGRYFLEDIKNMKTHSVSLLILFQ